MISFESKGHSSMTGIELFVTNGDAAVLHHNLLDLSVTPIDC